MFPSEPAKFQAKTFVIFFFICLFLEWAILEYRNSYTVLDEEDFMSQNEISDKLPIAIIDKIVIGIVSCQRPRDSTPQKIFLEIGIHEQALVMMRTILISAKLYGVKKVDFHLFVENPSDSVWFHKNMAKNGWVENAGVEVTMHFHNAMTVAPEKHRKHMIYHLQYRCGFVRMFFSSALPEVDSIIYLDSDVIVTGNIAELWGRLGKMKGEQVIGVARKNEPKNYWVDHLDGFGDILPLHEQAPKGLDNGVLVMNLTKMRQHRWEERFVRVYEEFKKVYPNMENQRTLNLMTYFDPGSLHLVPCNFDVMHTNCDHGWVCKPALKDPFGVQAVHGAGGQFGRNGRFRKLFIAYRNFAWGLSGDNGLLDNDDEFGKRSGNSSSNEISLRQKYFMKRIVKPVRKSYEFHYNKMDRSKSIKAESKCYGTLNKLLFKNYDKFLV